MLKYSANVTYGTNHSGHPAAIFEFVELGTQSSISTNVYGVNHISTRTQRAIMIELDLRIAGGRPVPLCEEAKGEFVLEVDWQTELRIRLANWFVEKSGYGSYHEVFDLYSRLSDKPISEMSYYDVFQLFKKLDTKDYMSIVHAFNIPHTLQIKFD